MNVTYQIVYWRDIPAQVRLRSGRERLAKPLPDRFQEAIDEAAMRARVTNADDYLDEWLSSEWQERPGTLESVANELVMEIDASYPPERLEALKQNLGLQPRAAKS